MKTVVPYVLLAVGLVACTPLATYYKSGISVAQLDADTTGCAVRALRDAPVANQIRQRPPVFIPGTQICDSAGACYQRPGYWTSGGVYTVDVNAGLRDRVRDLCMAQIGYQPVNIPRCPADVIRAAPDQATTRLPRLTENACSIPRANGTWQIVNPVKKS